MRSLIPALHNNHKNANVQGAMSNIRDIDKDRTKVQCCSIVIAIHGYHNASLIMHHACVYYLLSDESISLRFARNDVAQFERLSHATKRFVSVHLSRSSSLAGVYASSE